jgi:hypothetical protein
MLEFNPFTLFNDEEQIPVFFFTDVLEGVDDDPDK